MTDKQCDCSACKLKKTVEEVEELIRQDVLEELKKSMLQYNRVFSDIQHSMGERDAAAILAEGVIDEESLKHKSSPDVTV